MQKYEQHLFGLGVKTGTKKDHFQTYNKKRGKGAWSLMSIFINAIIRVLLPTNACTHYMVQEPFYPNPSLVREDIVAVTGNLSMEATQPVQSSSNLLIDIQINVLASVHPGLKKKSDSESLWDYVHPCAPPEGEKTLSVLSPCNTFTKLKYPESIISWNEYPYSSKIMVPVLGEK